MLTEQVKIDDSISMTQVEFSKFNEVGSRCVLNNCQFDDYSYIGPDSDVANATIGKFCSIASKVRINPGNHPMHRAALHHFTYRAKMYGFGEDEQDFFKWRQSSWVNIGHDVWIGHGATILPGVNIGNGAVIAAGAVVSKDVEPFEIVGGVPAKQIRLRFSHTQIEQLQQISWWHWNHDQLKTALENFRNLDIDDFIKCYA